MTFSLAILEEFHKVIHTDIERFFNKLLLLMSHLPWARSMAHLSFSAYDRIHMIYDMNKKLSYE